MNTSSSFESVAKGLLNNQSTAEEIVHRRYVHHLVRLARNHISAQFNAKVDPEDVVQSVFKSFFVRHRDGKVLANNWNELWHLLARITTRKCIREVTKLQAEKRSVRRELSLNGVASNEFQLPDRQPNSHELVVFKETLNCLISPLTDVQKEIVALKLSGYSKVEISKKINRSERTVHRAFDVLKELLEKLQSQE